TAHSRVPHPFPTRRSSDLLADSMSDYLIRQIRATPNIDVRHHVQVAGATGAATGHLQSLVLQDTDSGARRSVPADALFVLVGSRSEEHTSELQSPYDLVCR